VALIIYQLKYCCDEIAPVLTAIFTQSLNSGSLPEDCLTANVIPNSKKEIELTLEIIDPFL